MVVSKKDTSPFASKLRLDLTHSTFFLNSSTSPMTARVDMESTMLPPWFSQLCPALVRGISSSVPQANFLYPFHECMNMALTAACLSLSASPRNSDPRSFGLSPSGRAFLTLPPYGAAPPSSLSRLPPPSSCFAGAASAACFLLSTAGASLSCLAAFSASAFFASMRSSSALSLLFSSSVFSLSWLFLAVLSALVLTSRSAASCSDCDARKTLSASLFFCSTPSALWSSLCAWWSSSCAADSSALSFSRISILRFWAEVASDMVAMTYTRMRMRM
mmetsp:Transcript_27474/g.69682  ORF Transcript_27474/g.69682 Transcript_27474/m.69682 type:complete len:275 (-) Transcript_27474:279-1103(-)